MTGAAASDPTGEELAAIVAAVEILWPRSGAPAAGPVPVPVESWRFSGRWWARPALARRERPWLALGQ